MTFVSIRGNVPASITREPDGSIMITTAEGKQIYIGADGEVEIDGKPASPQEITWPSFYRVMTYERGWQLVSHGLVVGWTDER